MTDTSHPISDRFSWKRVEMTAHYYLPKCKKQMLIYALMSLITGIVTVMALSDGSDKGFLYSAVSTTTFLIYGLLWTALKFMFYFSPCIFANSPRDVNTSLPALCSEKATVILSYIFIILPILTFGPAILCVLIYHFINPAAIPIYTQGCYLFVGFSPISYSSVDALIIPAVFALVMFRDTRTRFGRAAWFSILALVLIQFVSIILAVFWIVIPNFDAIVSASKMGFGEEFVNTLNLIEIDITATCIYLAIFATLIWMICRNFKKFQI
ncbi:MAG: hypothetical protein NC111_05015 [Bacteroides sp.]|nr:hypothetical protein [Bacteroides sp.]MCM1413688.1 hypothetical protein [Bacteroides sp.]MCM1471867.1 hypothetical protein [Bacteroides sp.]